MYNTFSFRPDSNSMRRKTNVGQLMLIAQDCIQKSQYNNAIKILSQVTELENKNDEAYRLLGDCFDQLGEREEAEKNYKIGIDCNPLSILCYANYGLLLYNMGRKGEAEKLYQLSMEINPRDPTVLNNYMVLLFQMGKFDKAEEISKLCLQVDPGNPNCKMYLNKISTSRIKEQKKVTRPGPGKGHSNQEQLLELLWQRDQMIAQKDNSISDLKIQLLARQKQIKDLQTQIQKLQKKRTEDQNMRSCKICLNNTAMYLNKKCGHLSACKGCLAIVGKNCPLCRETGSFIRVYSSLIREDLY